MTGTEDFGKEPIKHVRRTDLPWRPAILTICGRPCDEFAAGRVITIAEAQAMEHHLGQQRASLFLCQSCTTYHYRSWREWEDDPVDRMTRELENPYRHNTQPGTLIDRELRAIAILIEGHRDEFDQLIADQESGGLVAMADLRRQKRARR